MNNLFKNFLCSAVCAAGCCAGWLLVYETYYATTDPVKKAKIKNKLNKIKNNITIKK